MAPLKSSQNYITFTIPRLELWAALLLVRHMLHHLKLLKDVITIDRIRASTDSTVVLAWLIQEQNFFLIFMTNKVVKIQALLPNFKWAHVITTANFDDPASRGMLLRDLLSYSRHLEGRDDDHWSVLASMKVAITTENLLQNNCTPTKREPLYGAFLFNILNAACSTILS